MVDFDKIYKDYYKRSFWFVKSYVFEDMAAEDIVSESLISLWQTMRKEEVVHSLSLLLTILKNNSLNYLKSQERRLDMMDSFSSVEAKAELGTIVQADIDRTINALRKRVGMDEGFLNMNNIPTDPNENLKILVRY